MTITDIDDTIPSAPPRARHKRRRLPPRPRHRKAAGTPSKYAQRLARLKILRARAEDQKRAERRMTHKRIVMAEMLLAEIIDGADVIGEGVRADEMDGWTYRENVVHLLVTMPAIRFRQLCEIGAELEDAEDSHDHEPGEDREMSLGSHDSPNQQGWCIGNSQDQEGPACDDEPSLGSCDGIVDQTRWTEGYRPAVEPESDDNADAEPSLALETINQERWSAGDRQDLEEQCEDEGGQCDDEGCDVDGESSLVAPVGFNVNIAWGPDVDAFDDRQLTAARARYAEHAAAR